MPHPNTVDATGQVSKDRVLVFGGYDNQNPLLEPALNKVWELQDPHLSFTAPTNRPEWQAFGGNGARSARMVKAREYANAVLMPDLSVIVFGGSEVEFHPYGDGFEKIPVPVYEPERLDFLNPSAGWTPLAPAFSPRLSAAARAPTTSTGTSAPSASTS